MRELDSIPQRFPSVVSRLLDEEAVLVHPVQGKIRVLNPVGPCVGVRRRSTDVVRISHVIAAEFPVDLTRVQIEVPAFCEDLARRGVLTFDR